MATTGHRVIELRRPSRPAPRGRILCVDDDPAVVTLLMRRLTRAGYDVVGTAEPRRAMEQLVSAPNPFHALVTDQNMPDMTGLELAQCAVAARPRLVVFLATARTDCLDPDELVDSKVSYLLAKPFEFPPLLAALAEVCGQGSDPRPAVV
jgi:two-component system cell cycle sensor histidine kinase/response regulator CckA